MSSNRPGPCQAIPARWLGTWKGWEDSCDCIADSLVMLPPHLLATHTYVIGATGSGKSICLQNLVAADICRGHSVAILDARGVLPNTALELATRTGIDPSLVKYFNLRAGADPLGFNPLGGAGEPYFKALGFVSAVAADFDSLGPQVAEYLQNATLILAATGQPITALTNLFHERAFRLKLIAAAQTDSLKAFWKQFDELSVDKQTSIASSVLNKTSALVCTEGLRRMFGHSYPVDLGTHLRTPGSVTLVSLAADQLQDVSWRIGSLFLNSICREVFSQVDVPESQRNPIRLYVDEFEHFSGKQFELIIAEARQFHLSVVLAHQSLAQLSPTMRSIILDNVGVKIILRTSHASAEILNRDIAGVRGAFDIAGLKVGEAILSIRGMGAQHIELNAPIIAESGGLSERAAAFLEQSRRVASTATLSDAGAPQSSESTPTGNVAHSPEQKRRRPPRGRLEDWLD